MSRTDQHAPIAVRIARGDLAAVECHDHRDGRCDLPVRTVYDRGWPPNTRCTWEFDFTGTFVCSCQLCHGGRQRRADRRSARCRHKKSLRVALGHWTAGDQTAFDEL